MTDDNHDKLVQMAREINSQDNACTHQPIFYVQRHKRTYGFDPAYSDDRTVYVSTDECHELSVAERKEDYAAAMAEEDDPDVKDVGTETYDEWLKLYHRPRPEGDDTDETRQAQYAEFVKSCEETHFEEWCENNENYTLTAYQDTWENVQPFFTRAGAEAYLRSNAHNLRGVEEPRIYVESAYRNFEWIAIREMLARLKLTEELLSEIKAAEKPAAVVTAYALHDADPNCVHNIVHASGGGVKCTQCTGWFCY